MSRKKQSADAGVVRRPRPAPRPFIDARLLLVAGVIASPAAYRSSQGLLSPSTAIDRFLLIAAGCLALSAVVRAIWPVVIGESKPAVPPAINASPALDAVVVDDQMTIPPVGSGLDLLEDDIDPTALLDLP